MPTINPPTFDLSTVPEQDRARVAALIPATWVADAYVHRSIEGVYDFDYLDMAVEESENVILQGPTGSSKTTLFRAYAASRGLPFVRIDSNASMDLATIIGRTSIAHVDGLAIDEWIDGNMLLVIRYGGVLLIDEVNMIHARVAAGFHQLLDVMRTMTVPEHTESIEAGCGGTGSPQPVLLAAAYNDRYQGTVRLNEAFSNRFDQHHEWGYLREVEEQLVDSARLLDFAYDVRDMAEIRTPVSTNALMTFERHVRKLGIGPAQRMFVNRFASEERTPVARALEAHSSAIESEVMAAA
jgi:MoxR-like ATPase